MTFKVDGSIRAHWKLETTDDIELSLDGGNEFRMSVGPSNDPNHDFTFHIEAASQSDAQKNAERQLDDLCNCMAYFFNSPIEDWQINHITAIESGSVTSRQRMSMGARIVTAVPASAVEKFRRTYPRLEKTRFMSKWQQSTVLATYRSAKGCQDITRKFWEFYIILDILLGSREGIDTFIKQHHKNVRQVVNNYEKGHPMRTITIAIRDMFSHANARFDHGQKLDLAGELDAHIADLEEIVRCLIEKKINRN